jgi:hypothetical protein
MPPSSDEDQDLKRIPGFSQIIKKAIFFLALA